MCHASVMIVCGETSEYDSHRLKNLCCQVRKRLELLICLLELLEVKLHLINRNVLNVLLFLGHGSASSLGQAAKSWNW